MLLCGSAARFLPNLAEHPSMRQSAFSTRLPQKYENAPSGSPFVFCGQSTHQDHRHPSRGCNHMARSYFASIILNTKGSCPAKESLREEHRCKNGGDHHFNNFLLLCPRFAFLAAELTRTHVRYAQSQHVELALCQAARPLDAMASREIS
jgi:hypothetical protein